MPGKPASSTTGTVSMRSLIAYEQIRDLIITGAKLPGARLVIAELEEELGIGRGAIREALMRLDRSGLVHNVPYKGVVVAAPPQMREIESIYALRLDVEKILAREAMHRLREKDFAILDEFVKKFGMIQDVEYSFFSLDRQFHSYIYQSSGMFHLCGLVDKMMDTIEVYLNLYTYESEDRSAFIDEHVTIVRLLREKNESELAAVMEANIMGGLRLVKSAHDKIIQNKAGRGPERR